MSQNSKRALPKHDEFQKVSEELDQLLTQLRQSCESVKEWAEDDLLNQLSEAIAGLPECDVDDAEAVKQLLFPQGKKICRGEVAAVLFEQLNSESMQMRRAAIQVVKLQPLLLIDYVSPMLYHDDVEVRKLAIELVLFCERDEACYWLHSIVLEDQSEQVVGRAIEALCDVGNSLTLPLLNRIAARFHYSDYIQFAVAYTRQSLIRKTWLLGIKGE